MPVTGFLGHTLEIILIVVGLLSGTLSILRELQLMYLPAKADDKKVFWAFSRIAFVVAAVLLWSDEHEKVVQLSAHKEDKPITINVPQAQVIITPSQSDKSNPSPFVGSLNLAKVEFPPSLDANPFAVNIHLVNAGQAPIPDAYFWEIVEFTPIGQINSQEDSNAADKKAYSRFSNLGKKAVLDSRRSGHAPTYYSIGEDHWVTINLHPRSEEADSVLHGTTRLYFFAYAEWSGSESQYTACRWLQPPAEVNYGNGANLVLHDCVW